MGVARGRVGGRGYHWSGWSLLYSGRGLVLTGRGLEIEGQELNWGKQGQRPSSVSMAGDSPLQDTRSARSL